MRTILLSLLFTVSVAQADEAARYRDCVDLAKAAPRTALERAREWEAEAPSAPARHCRAIALNRAGESDAAATLFVALADEVARGVGLSRDMGDTPEKRAALETDLLAQAGNSWLMAGKASEARAVLDKAVAKAKGEARLAVLIDRGRALFLLKDYAGARADFDEALAAIPDDPDLLVYRATARLALGDEAGGNADLDLVLKIDPGNSLALKLKADE